MEQITVNGKDFEYEFNFSPDDPATGFKAEVEVAKVTLAHESEDISSSLSKEEFEEIEADAYKIGSAKKSILWFR